MSKESDEVLMQRVRDGDRECAGLLVRRYASALLTYVVRMIGNHDLGEELVQDVFLAVWEKRHQYQPQRPFRPWLYTIATNRCRLHFRRARPTADFDEALLEDGSGFDPASAADRAETQKIVAEAVTELPHRQRSVVVLRMWNGLSYAEIATAVQCSEATARSHMHHGLASLRRFLEPRLGKIGIDVEQS